MSSPLQTIHVALGERSYDIDVGHATLAAIGQRIVHETSRFSQAIIVTDSNVGPLYASGVQRSLQTAGVTACVLTMEAGERSKSVAAADRLWQEVLGLGADRQSLIVALGGGVIGDLAGFLAATFARGIRLIQLPTTLLAQVDSSVGGKVGINLPGAKNIVGCFWQPTYVGIDLAVLTSLPQREFAAGMAEVVKYGVIRDADLFELLEREAAAILQRDTDVTAQIVARCCRIKADVVEADEREQTGQRAILNYGHTFAHALESITGYSRYLHGEAVAIGMMCAARLAERLGLVGEEMVARQEALLRRMQLPSEMPECNADHLIQLMRRDKKATGGQIQLVLPDRLGHVVLRDDVDHASILSVL